MKRLSDHWKNSEGVKFSASKINKVTLVLFASLLCLAFGCTPSIQNESSTTNPESEKTAVSDTATDAAEEKEDKAETADKKDVESTTDSKKDSATDESDKTGKSGETDEADTATSDKGATETTKDTDVKIAKTGQSETAAKTDTAAKDSNTEAAGASKATTTTTSLDGFTMDAWTTDMDCSLCHSVEHDSFSNDSLPAASHPEKCLSCHGDAEALTTVHTSAKSMARQPSARVKNRIQNETCLGCHGSLESLAELTEDCTVLSDDKGRTVNPHAVPQVEGHDDPINCTSCHGMHKEKDPMSYCTGCHHEGGFECNTCHAV